MKRRGCEYGSDRSVVDDAGAGHPRLLYSESRRRAGLYLEGWWVAAVHDNGKIGDARLWRMQHVPIRWPWAIARRLQTASDVVARGRPVEIGPHSTNLQDAWDTEPLALKAEDHQTVLPSVTGAAPAQHHWIASMAAPPALTSHVRNFNRHFEKN